MMFTSDELKRMTVKSLKSLANYYDVRYAKSIRKDDLIDLILEALYVEPEVKEDEEENVSVRVRRLRRLNQ